MKETFGERIRRIRKERNLGLRETAKLIGKSATFLSRIETGKEQVTPAEETIRELARVLGDDFNELMQLAGRIPTEVKDYFTNDPDIPAFLRLAKEKRVSGEKLLEMLKKVEKGKRK